MGAAVKVAEIPARRGFAWLGAAFHVFRTKPFAWLGLCAGWMLITFVLAFILFPPVGSAIASFLQPVFFASFALAVRKQEQGGEPVMGDLFAGFRTHFRSLVMLGAILTLIELGILMLMGLMGLPTGRELAGVETIADYVKALKGKEWILLAGFFMTVAAKGALWFAPPLIALHGMSTSHAARWSVYAALANIGAMFAYGLTLMALFLLAMMPWGLGLLVAVPMMAISTYVGYREVFESRDQAPVSPPPPA